MKEVDFTATVLRTMRRTQPRAWKVGRYELKEDKIVDVSSHEELFGERKTSRTYKPLEDEPGLFFKFASLYESKDFATDALGWVRKYGPLREFDINDGFRWALSLEAASLMEHSTREEVDRKLREKHRLPSDAFPNLLDGLEGVHNPLAIELEELLREAAIAWDTLAHYEAHLNRNTVRLLNPPEAHGNPLDASPLSLCWPERDEDLEPYLIAEGEAKNIAADHVTWEVAHHCSFGRLMEGEGGTGAREPNARFAWDFHSLLGAMYLQMMWVLERGIRIGRCKWCDKLIPDRHPVKGKGEGSRGRKVNSNKVFCNNTHRVNYNRTLKRRNDMEQEP